MMERDDEDCHESNKNDSHGSHFVLSCLFKKEGYTYCSSCMYVHVRVL